MRHDANPIICGRRNCIKCGRWRHITDYGYKYVNHEQVVNEKCKYCASKAKPEIWLDFQPFRKWLLQQIEWHGGPEKVARIVGVDESRVRHFAHGYRPPEETQCDSLIPITRVKVATVDKYSVRLGDPGFLYRAYPLE